MLQDICNLFKGRVEQTRYFDTLAGLITIQEKKDITDKGVTLLSRFPVSSDVTTFDQGNGPIKDLVPDSSKRGIGYFEGSETKQGRRFTFGKQYLSNVRFVGWLNRDLITGNSNDMINTPIILEVMNAIIGEKYEAPPYKMITATVTGITENNPNIFSQYTYDNADMQYLMAPFTYFAIDMQVGFVLPHSACMMPLQLNVKQC